MRALGNVIFAAAAAAAAMAVAAGPASAACTRLGFSVNDYGKEGPTNDAKQLLDKYIETKMAERGIKTYRVGKKEVNCELFIDLIVFDEHTCRADATVCWDDTPLPKGEETAETGAAKKKTSAKSATAKPKTDDAAPATTTGSIESAPAPEPAATPAAIESAAPAAVTSEEAPSGSSSDAAAPSDGAPVEAVQP